MSKHERQHSASPNPTKSLRDATECPGRSPSPRQVFARKPALDRNAGACRGFTLLELMAVVIMIGILVALAVPATRAALRGKRAASAAKQIELIYQLAKLRSVGRGSAVLVRFNSQAPEYGFSVREAITGTANSNGTCDLQPVASCTRNPGRWNNPQLYREIKRFQPLPGGDASYENMSITFMENVGTSSFTRALADICFTPSGNTFIRSSSSGAFQLMTSVPSLLITEKNSGGQVIGIQRTIYVLPNGMARLAI